MKAIIVSILAAAGAANGQLNRSFELGDLTGYAVHDGHSAQSAAVALGADGELPSHGSSMLHLTAGELSQEEAADVMGMSAARLGKLYLSLGGPDGNEGFGDYNVLAADLPAGNFTLDYMFKTSDATPTYLDHAFVVNGASQITVLGDALSGDVDTWTEKTVSHPGGRLYLVVANGGDDQFDAHLYVDDTRIIDTNNGSFESNDFNHWTVSDAGAGNAFVTNEFIDGLVAPAGARYARLPAGNLPQDEAEEILGLQPGRLAQLYTELGGTGDPTGGDYLILSQTFGGSTISFDHAFKAADKGNATKLDHAFTVDSEGHITVLASTLDMDPTPTWSRTTVPHSGGRFFFVVANGNSPATDATLYLDDVVEGPPALDAASLWNGTDTFGNFGGIYKETIGQLVEPDERSMLEAIKFYVAEEDPAEPFQFQAFVYEWDGTKIVGNSLYASNEITTDGLPGGEMIALQTPGVVLEKYRCYIAFLTTTTAAPSTHYGALGSTGDVAPGLVLFNGADTFQELYSTGWLQASSIDLAFEAELAPIGAPVVPNVNQFVDGASFNQYPWNGGGDFRYQQLYAADEFRNQQGVIDSFAYRVHNIGQPFGPVDIDVQIWMGYTILEPGQITNTFDNNFTLGKTLVKDGTVTLSSTGNGVFDVVVDVDDVFYYDPEDGNLLVEIVFPFDGQPGVPQLDSAGYGFASGGTPWTDRLFATSADAATGIIGGDDGHVTRINFVGGDEPYDPDCNGDGLLNILDFVCFQGAFQAGDPLADCDHNGVLNILDFVCFQQAFVAACP